MIGLFDDAPGEAGRNQPDLIDLNVALEALAVLDKRRAQVVELRFFAGLKFREIAGAIGMSNTSVEEDWFLARAWLRRRLRSQ